MKKIFYLIIILFHSQVSVFCQSSLYSFGLDGNNPAIITMKFNQTNCSYDTISQSSNIAGCNISGFYGRGVTSTCDYFIFGYWCPPNDSTILFLGLNQDTSFTINYPFPLRYNVEVEYNPSDNCLYILGNSSPLIDSVCVYRCNLTTGHVNLLTNLPHEYASGYMEGRYNMCDIDIDSNIMYCGSRNKIAKISLASGIIDTLFPYLDDSTVCNHNRGLFFNQNNRLIFSISSYPNINADNYLVSYNPETNEKIVIGSTVPTSSETDFAYNDENDIYTIIHDKYYFYSSLNGALIDSCSFNDDVGYFHFYPKCHGSLGISTEHQTSNIKVYPTIANEHLLIDLKENTQKIYYNIYDNSGRDILSGKFENIILSPVSIKLPQLIPGYYFIQVRTDNSCESFKFLKLISE